MENRHGKQAETLGVVGIATSRFFFAFFLGVKPTSPSWAVMAG